MILHTHPTLVISSTACKSQIQKKKTYVQTLNAAIGLKKYQRSFESYCKHMVGFGFPVFPDGFKRCNQGSPEAIPYSNKKTSNSNQHRPEKQRNWQQKKREQLHDQLKLLGPVTKQHPKYHRAVHKNQLTMQNLVSISQDKTFN
jgi:hypothetical protein